MQIESVIAVRRSLLRGALSLLGVAASAAVEAGGRPARRRNREQTLRARASAHVYAQFGQYGAVIVGPISLLQREYHLGYQAALNLADQLEQDAVWTVFRDASGMRCARRSGEYLG
jgi:DNA segregation ATPase FtsK/SpoIIIE-like protein